MSEAIEALLSTISWIESILEKDPWAICNESELQALLQVGLNDRLSELPPLVLDEGVNNRRPSQSFTARRVCRELKVEGGRASGEADLIVLTGGTQHLMAKANGAPARFECPYDMIIETKVDSNHKAILAGKAGRPIKADILKADIGKWQNGYHAHEIKSVVYTSDPDWYDGLRDVITIKRPIISCTPIQPSRLAVDAVLKAYHQAIDDVHEAYKANPFWFIREKDFETELLWRMRQSISADQGALHPARTQWHSNNMDVLGRRRRHDLIILSDVVSTLKLEVEIKTSHSDTHNWFRKKACQRWISCYAEVA